MKVGDEISSSEYDQQYNQRIKYPSSRYALAAVGYMTKS
ncbi:hypothetical protein ES319_A08G068500v1 [Gossypium barbadense]|uniref:Uncharacterized protein n=2 Tax=Gossypium TaxID=3633 RepID=A0A5J5UM13_GOSBA|nr:hypothetical protein ES319_A08G068500v1 [Gossypium barbadense]TYH05313.1 hypothetical protein ES288_A08G073400v1 [Gossypium darwinii]